MLFGLIVLELFRNSVAFVGYLHLFLIALYGTHQKFCIFVLLKEMGKTHQLNNIQISGFKSIRALDLPLREMNVLIGANGAGKSNFIGLFKFIRYLVEERLQTYVAQKGGAEKFLFYGSKITESIEVKLDFEPNHYYFKLVPGRGDKLIFEKEECWFDTQTGYVENINKTQFESDLAKYGREQKFDVGNYVFNVLASWRLYHFHDTSDSAKVKKMGKRNDVDYLREDASNLAAFLLQMQKKNPMHYQRIVKVVQMVVPFFRDFYLRPVPDNPDYILLEWTDKFSDAIFSADDLSDGSLRFICLATLLLQPEMPKLILLDEPELGLHPSAIILLASLLQTASSRTQVIVATQSDKLVNEMNPEDIIVVDHEENESTFTRLTNVGLETWLKEYQLGDLWNQNVFGGRP